MVAGEEEAGQVAVVVVARNWGGWMIFEGRSARAVSKGGGELCFGMELGRNGRVDIMIAQTVAGSLRDGFCDERRFVFDVSS